MQTQIHGFHSPFFQATRRTKMALSVAILAMIGCSPETALSENERPVAVAEAPVPQQAETPTPAEPAAQTYSQKLAAALEKATAAKDAVVDQLSAASESGGQAASDSVTWATEMFNSLKDQGMTRAENTQQWLADDWKHAGAWEYHIVTADTGRDVAATLNDLGRERWECFHVVLDQKMQKTTFYLKRPAKSYLNNLPMKDLMHLLPLMGGGGSSGE